MQVKIFMGDNLELIQERINKFLANPKVLVKHVTQSESDTENAGCWGVTFAIWWEKK